MSTLKQAWSIALPHIAGTPVVSNGILYVTSATAGSAYGQYVGSIYAISESTGGLIWADGPNAQTGLGFSDIVGIAIDNGNVFAATSGSYLVSLNANTGALNWEVPIDNGLVENPQATRVGPQGTPLVWNGEIITSDVGGDSVARGFVRAFSESSGTLLWTFYTVPPSPMSSTNQGFYQNSWGACTYCGGGDNWNVPAIDPHTGLLYFGTGNPFPAFNASQRAPSSGYRNLYTDSVIALNATNGQMVWYYQEVAGDSHDWDAGQPVQLFNTTINGVQKEVVGSGGKGGFYYLLDATTGSQISATVLGIHRNINAVPSPHGEITYPGSTGGINTFYTYNPMTNLVYTTVFNLPTNYTSGPIGLQTAGGADNDVPGIPFNSTLYALNPSTGGIVWSVNLRGLAGGVSSSNNLVFTADAYGNYYAFNAQTGGVLWNYTSGKSNPSFLANWGPPSVTDGLLFETSMTANGGVMAFAPAVTTTTTATKTSSSSTTTTMSTIGTSPLTINSENRLGNTIAGYYTALYNQNGNLLGTGFTPVTYTLNNGQTYQIEADSYGSCTFNHWSGGGVSGSTADPVTLSITSPTTLTAVYGGANCGPQTTTTTSSSSTSTTSSSITTSSASSTTSTTATSITATSTTSMTSSTTSAGPTSVTVSSINQNGQTITGYWTALYNQNGGQLATGFTPKTFTGLIAGQTYQIEADSYGSCTFNHWSNGNTSDPMTFFAASSAQTFIATYTCT